MYKMTTIHNISLLNMNKICRICLRETDNMRSLNEDIDEKETLDPNIHKFYHLLEVFLPDSVTMLTDVPNSICFNCIPLLHSAYKFKVQFANSNNILRQYSENYIKAALDLNNLNNISNSDDYDSTGTVKCIESISEIQNGNKPRSQTHKLQVMKNVELKCTRKLRKRRTKVVTDEPVSCNFASDNEIQQNVRLHSCPICTKEFTALKLREHAHAHQALKKYLSIPAVYKVSSDTKFYVKNTAGKPKYLSIHNRKLKLHKCVMCTEEFPAADLRIHLTTHRNQREFKCDQCDRVFRKLNHLNTHRVKHLKEYPFKCEQCGKGFVIQTNYNCHMLTHNKELELPHECRYCFRRFSNPEHLNRHTILHTENVSYSLKYKVCRCKHCLRTFRDRAELKMHDCAPIEQVANKRFPCKTCHKVFKNASGLYNHNRNIHKGSKVLCSVCGNYVSNIYNHMMRHTGEKPFVCNQCGKRFIGNSQLRQHLLVHSGVKPFVCSVCAKAFNNLYNLQVHERIHKGDRCHVCSICKKGFLEKSYLKKHMHVHSKL